MNIKIDDLISQINIVDVISQFSTLFKSGSSYKTLCNVHGDSSPSLFINPRKQIYKCFVCNHGGNVIDYLIWAQKYSFNEAIKYLSKSIGIEFDDSYLKKNKYSEKQNELITCLNDSKQLFQYYLDITKNEDQLLKEFIKKRNITNDEIKKYGLGFSCFNEKLNYLNSLRKKSFDDALLINASLLNEDLKTPFFNNRIIFPIFDEDFNTIAFSGRILTSNKTQPKYIHSKESLVFKKNNVIYNYNNASKYESLIIVEGFMDVIALNKIDNDNAIALMGVALSKNQISKLENHKEINIFLDNDEAGIQSTLSIIDSLIKRKINGHVIFNNTPFKDADEIVNSADGKELLKKIITQKIDFISYVYKYFSKDVDRNDFNQTKNMLLELKKYLIYIDKLKFDFLVKEISNDFKIEESTIKDILIVSSNMLKFNDKPNRDFNQKTYKKEVLNIEKILLALYKNPSLLNVQEIENIQWNSNINKHYKLLSYLRKQQNNKEKLPLDVQRVFEEYERNIPSGLIPKNKLDLIEAIKRHNEIEHIDFIYIEGNNKKTEEEKISVTELLINKLNKKIKE